MELLYTVIKERIEEIIEKKRNKIKAIECDILKANSDKNTINELHREINLLHVTIYKIGEIMKFIQDIEKT